MTNYLMSLVDELLTSSPYSMRIGTPRDERRRTGHVAILHEFAEQIVNKLIEQDVVVDFRPPNIIRVAPSAPYNTFSEIWEVIHKIKTIIDENTDLQE